ncbi:hypothetical protein IRB23SM22_22330 [Alkalibacterium sp. s-m-22]
MQKTRSFPKEAGFENGLKVLREGYMYALTDIRSIKQTHSKHIYWVKRQ